MRITDIIFKSIDIIYKNKQNPKSILSLKGKTIKEEVSYKNDKDCKMDFYYKEKDLKPILFYIHGGGFVAGDKKYRTALSYRLLNDLDIKIFNINYIMSPRYKIIDSVRCIVDAINYIYDNKELYKVDMNKFIIAGDSSGGYFASFISELSVNKKLQERLNIKIKTNIKASILNCGVYSFNELFRIGMFGLEKDMLIETTGYKRIKDYEFKDILSIEDFVTKDFPYSFIIGSNHDNICKNQHNILLNKLNEIGVSYEPYISNKKDAHVFQLNWNTESSKDVTIKMIDFIKRNTL